MDPKLLALVTALTFGMAPVVLKLAFRRGGQAGIGIIIGLVVAIPLNFAFGLVIDPHYERLNAIAIAWFVLGGLAGSALGRYWNYVSIDILGPSRSVTIRSSSPVFTAFLAVLLYGEQITLQRWAAIVAIVGGAAVVSWHRAEGARGRFSTGVLYALGAAVAYGLRPIFIKAGLESANVPLAASVVGAAAALAYTAIREPRESFRITRLDAAFWWFLVGGVLQAIAQLTLALGLSGGDVSLVYALTSSAPLFTIVFTWLFLRGAEPITPRLLLGAIAVVAGVIYL